MIKDQENKNNQILNFEPSSVQKMISNAAVHNYLEDELSLIEKTAQRVKPIIEALQEKLVREKVIDQYDSDEKEPQIDQLIQNDGKSYLILKSALGVILNFSLEKFCKAKI